MPKPAPADLNTHRSIDQQIRAPTLVYSGTLYGTTCDAFRQKLWCGVPRALPKPIVDITLISSSVDPHPDGRGDGSNSDNTGTLARQRVVKIAHLDRIKNKLYRFTDIERNQQSTHDFWKCRSHKTTRKEINAAINPPTGL
jgi:hypothetical protein